MTPPDPVAPRAGSRPASFRTNVALTTLTNVAIAGSGVVTGLIAARILGPVGRGELAAIFGWPLLIAGLATLGLPDAIVYFCARERARAGAYFTTALAIAVAVSAVFAVVGWVLMPVVLAAQDDGVVTAARWFLVSVPLAATLGMADRPLRGIGDFRSWNIMRSAPTVAWLAILLVALARGGASPAALALAFLLARVALVGPMLRYVRNRVPGRWVVERPLARPLLRYGLPSFVTVLPTILNQRLDQIIMAGFLPARTLGLYAVAVAWSGMLAPALLAFANVIFPRIASDDQTDEERAAVFARGMRVGVILAVVLGLGAAAITPVVLPALFGADFEAAVVPALVLVAAAVVAGVNQVGEEGLRGLGRPGLVLRSEACGLVVTAISLAVLVGRFELMGAAVASLAGYSTIGVFVVLGGRRATGLPVRALLLADRDDLTAIRANLRRRP